MGKNCINYKKLVVAQFFYSDSPPQTLVPQLSISLQAYWWLEMIAWGAVKEQLTAAAVATAEKL